MTLPLIYDNLRNYGKYTLISCKLTSFYIKCILIITLIFFRRIFNVINLNLVVGSLTPKDYNMTIIIHSNLFLSVILQIIAQFSLKVEIGSVVPERIKLEMWKANSILHKKTVMILKLPTTNGRQILIRIAHLSNSIGELRKN